MARRKGKGAECGYEAIRHTCVLESQARLESLGLFKTLSQLRQNAALSEKPKRSCGRVFGVTPLRRSRRINGSTLSATTNHPPLPRSGSLRRNSSHHLSPKEEKATSSEGEEKSLSCGEEEKERPANAPFVKLKGTELHSSVEDSAQRCKSNGRGSVYNSTFGICCHFCRMVILRLVLSPKFGIYDMSNINMVTVRPYGSSLGKRNCVVKKTAKDVQFRRRRTMPRKVRLFMSVTLALVFSV